MQRPPSTAWVISQERAVVRRFQSTLPPRPPKKTEGQGATGKEWEGPIRRVTVQLVYPAGPVSRPGHFQERTPVGAGIQEDTAGVPGLLWPRDSIPVPASPSSLRVSGKSESADRKKK